MRLLLVDGTNAVMRYAFAMLGAAQAEPRPADIPAVARAAEKAIRECAIAAHCGHAAIALDTDGDTWRRELYPEYKATRLGGTGAWSARLRDHLSAAGWQCLEAPGFEADDVIATLARRASEAGHASAVLSSDSDLLQLADEGCAVYQFGSKTGPRFAERSPIWIAKKYGLQSSGQLALYKALVGEPGDNLPGVQGVGPKRAASLLQLYRSAQDLVDAGAFAKQKREQLALMLRLVTLREDVPLPALVPSACQIPMPPEALR